MRRQRPRDTVRRTAMIYSLLLLVCSTLVVTVASRAFAQASASSLADTWQGTLNVDKGLRTVLKITKAADGYQAVFYSIDQGGDGIPVTKITLDGSTVLLTITAIDGKYEGKLRELYT